MTDGSFSYQSLRVYRDMIRSIALVEDLAATWDSVHAIVDHISRASEGALVCLAEACRSRHAASRLESVGHCLGSVLECAACLDVAMCKSLSEPEACREAKQNLSSVFRQLHALRKAWEVQACGEVREGLAEYGETCMFHHERLKVYKLALQVCRNIASWRLIERQQRFEFRRVDEGATSIVLNIAEGNGRFSHLDHSRFLEIASSSNTKLAARFEILALRGTIDKNEAAEMNRLLVEIDRMTAKLADVWRKGRE